MARQSAKTPGRGRPEPVSFKSLAFRLGDLAPWPEIVLAAGLAADSRPALTQPRPAFTQPRPALT